MNNIRYHAPKTLTEAVKYLADNPDVKIIAGGTDLYVGWAKQGYKDMHLMDIRNIENFADVKEVGDSIFIGAGALMSDLQYSEVVLKNYPILSEAAGRVGSVQMRNMATVGGNSCNAAPSADTVTPLIVYAAEAVIVSAKGERKSELRNFFKGVGKTVLEQGEMLKGFLLPKPSPKSAAVFVKHSRRVAMDLATVSVSVNVVADKNNNFKDVRIAMGVVSPTPVFVNEFDEFYGTPIDNYQTIKKMVEIAAAKTTPRTSLRGTKEYREEMINLHLEESLKKAVEMIKNK